MNSMLICPAYAGMILGEQILIVGNYDLSRVCGDDPNWENRDDGFHQFVPRMRG